MPTDNAIVVLFSTLFSGRQDIWGSAEGRANKEPVTIENYRSHLEGKVSLGVYPLLDNNTIKFFAIDIDEKSFEKCLAIRKAFFDLGLPVYIAESRRKGYHIYGFCEIPLVASGVRQVCLHILNELKVTAEIFPKQSTLDAVTPFGNYINLPCFSDTRQFMTVDKQYVAIIDALPRIKKIGFVALSGAISKIHAAVSAPQPLKDIKPDKKILSMITKGKHPSCIDVLLKGVSEGSRDVAAFAIARHFLNQGYSEDEVSAFLIVWDTHNNPPVGNIKTLQDKVRSASKGYAFGCSSIIDEPLLSRLCVGEENCKYFQKDIKDKIKKGKIIQSSFHEDSEHLYEEIVFPDRAAFACFNKGTQQISIVPRIDTGDISILPIWGQEITKNVVLLPTGYEEYGSTKELISDIKDFISTYVDIPRLDMEMVACYILNSWVYDRLNTISYLRFFGGSGTGKSQALNTVARLCYKPIMMAASITPAPIFRIADRFKGTLVIEEADLKESDVGNEIVKILCAGFQRWRTIIRCAKDDPDSQQYFDPFGPKVFAARYKFDDVALESRCITINMKETDKDDIPEAEGKKFHEKIFRLRNKLLLWRFRNLCGIDPEESSSINLGKLEPRLRQVGRSFALPFKNDTEVMEDFKKFMQDLQYSLVVERSDSSEGRVMQALFKLARENGKASITFEALSKTLSEGFNLDLKSRTIGKILTSLGVKRRIGRVAGEVRRFIIWDPKIMRNNLKRYFTPEEVSDYTPLVDGNGKEADNPPMINIDLDV